jgi:hypothetical protein
MEFDDKTWPLPVSGTLVRSLLEYGFVLNPVPPIQLFHMYIAKPYIIGSCSPDLVQYIVTTTPPDKNGKPISSIAMREPCPGYPTQNALHVCSFLLNPMVDGGGIVQPYNIGFRKGADGYTAMGEVSYYAGTLTCVIGVPTLTVSLPYVPANASFVRMVLYLRSDVGYTSVTKLWFETNVGGGLAINQSYKKFSANPGQLIQVDAPVCRPNTPGGVPYIILTGDAVYKLDYDILGWLHAPNNIITSRG